jgi:hypothetical protein
MTARISARFTAEAIGSFPPATSASIRSGYRTIVSFSPIDDIN